MRRNDVICIIIELLTWTVLILEHCVFHLDLALEFMCVWGVFTLLHLIKIVLSYAVTITHEE